MADYTFPKKAREENINISGLPRRLELFPNRDDIMTAKCGDPAHCIIANTVKRQLRLDKKARVHVDANGVFITIGDWRGHWVSDRTTPMALLRTFDDLGAEDGEERARKVMAERQEQKKTKLLYNLHAAKPKEKSRPDVNKASRERVKAGTSKKYQRKAPRPRYAGTCV